MSNEVLGMIVSALGGIGLIIVRYIFSRLATLEKDAQAETDRRQVQYEAAIKERDDYRMRFEAVEQKFQAVQHYEGLHRLTQEAMKVLEAEHNKLKANVVAMEATMVELGKQLEASQERERQVRAEAGEWKSLAERRQLENETLHKVFQDLGVEFRPKDPPQVAQS